MFVIIKYGDDKEVVVNAGCLVVHFFQFVQQKCFPNEDSDNSSVQQLEVSDEMGLVKNIRLKPTEYAHSLLTDRESLILLRVTAPAVVTDNTAAVTDVQFTPLLTSKRKDEQFMAKLNRKQKPTKKTPSNDTKASKASSNQKAGSGTSDDGRSSRSVKKTGMTSKPGSRMSSH